MPANLGLAVGAIGGAPGNFGADLDLALDDLTD